MNEKEKEVLPFGKPACRRGRDLGWELLSSQRYLGIDKLIIQKSIIQV